MDSTEKAEWSKWHHQQICTKQTYINRLKKLIEV